MKKILLVLFVATVSCSCKQQVAITPSVDTTVQDKKYDSVIHINDSLIISNKSLRVKLNSTYDSNKVYRATQKELNRFMDICIKDPSQLVFLKGWYLRAERIK